MSSFTDQLRNQLNKKNVWVFFYSKGEDVSIFYNRTAAKMIVECMNHSALHGIHATEITFAKVLMFNGEPMLAKLSADMIRDAHAAALSKN
jgi:hypothetical protein